MASLYQHRSGAWHVSVYLGRTPQGQVRTRTKTFRDRQAGEAYMKQNGLTHSPRQTGEPIQDRIRRLTIIDERGCWLWQGHRGRDGYGVMTYEGNTGRNVHRVSYEAFVGPIPDGLQIDHLCMVRHCANPEHLEPVTAEVNNQRRAAAARAQAVSA